MICPRPILNKPSPALRPFRLVFGSGVGDRVVRLLGAVGTQWEGDRAVSASRVWGFGDDTTRCCHRYFLTFFIGVGPVTGTGFRSEALGWWDRVSVFSVYLAVANSLFPVSCPFPCSGRWNSSVRKQDGNQIIPLVVESCICFISRHGLQHEGIFRVSGSQIEVNDIKNAFERGEDPLAGDQNDHDIDSIAGVLKLHFRGLASPLFPKEIFHDLISCVSKLD
ncbi:hypothetical protein chiPu_0022117 [Chiloscyllium punctatum]|uniref:Rho-GAP domain-containing protein n=1 Tax=Chiloscyllium punctatum TaxID=137246 RepID=A0A401RKQ4_CHIPU|nr:hypothetical protein [Chiloscyllium punctatum]